MAESIKKTKQSYRTQGSEDLKNIFDYKFGSAKIGADAPDSVQETRELWTHYNQSREEWAQKFKEAEEFRAGAQWTKEQQEILESRGQAPIVVNRIHPIVETAKALLSYRTPQFRATAREDSDKKVAKVFSDLFQWVWDQSNGNNELKRVIDDYYVGGMGVFNVYQDPDADMGKGEVLIKSIHPLDVYVDPNSRDPYFRDAANIIVASYMTEEHAEQVYPEFINIIKNASDDPEANQDYPTTKFAKMEDQTFIGDYEDRAHEKKRFLERYTKELHSYHNTYEPFSNREYVFNEKQQEIYLREQYVRIRKITGEETIVFQEEAVGGLIKDIIDNGPIFHFALPPGGIGENGQPIEQEPERVAGHEETNPYALAGSTFVLIPITVEELIGTGEITSNKVEIPRIKMVVSCGQSLLYERILPIEEYPIVPLCNTHLRTPYPESDVRLYRPLQEYINKIRSLIIAHASTSTNVKLLIPRGSVDKRQIEEEWGRAGTGVIEFDAELGAPIVAGPVPLPNELYKNEADAKSDLEYGFGIYELMQGGSQNAPSTYRGTVIVDEFGQRRIKSRRDDIENALNQLAKAAVPLMQQLYTEEKVIRIVSPSGEQEDQRVNFYAEMPEGDIRKMNDVTVGKYDIQVVSGSTLPTNRMAELDMYKELYQMGLIDQVEVLKKSELIDVEGVLERSGQMQQMAQMIEQLQAELKNVKGDLQTASREEVHAKKRLELEKFGGTLDKISNRADAATSLYKARLEDQRKNLIDSSNSKKENEES